MGVCVCLFRPRPGPDLVPLRMYVHMNTFNPLCRCVCEFVGECVCEMRGVPAIPGGRPLASSPVARHEAQSKHDGS